MNRNILGVTLLTATLGLLSSCGTSKKSQEGDGIVQKDMIVSKVAPGEMDKGYLILSDSQREFVKKNNQLALNFFSKVSGFDSKVISPLSLTYLMSVLANGADGQTREEILRTLGCEGTMSLDDLNAFCDWMMKNAAKQDPSTTVKIANYIGLNEQYELNKDYAQKMNEWYQATAEKLNFSNSKTVDHINGWCKKQTDGMIPSIIDQVDPQAVAYLMNAIYFNGAWEDKFDKSETKLERFQGYTRDIKKVQMMHREGKYLYTHNEMYSAIRMPYGNGSYSMYVLLPNSDKSIDEMMKSLDAEKLSSMTRHMDECLVDLKLPRFTSEQELGLNDIVSQLGAPSMFDASKANFANFANGNVYVSKMLQKAKIEVSEEGTKAAAVTAAAIMLTSLQPNEPKRVQFHADRPFVYMITESETGSIYFMGQFTGEN